MIGFGIVVVETVTILSGLCLVLCHFDKERRIFHSCETRLHLLDTETGEDCERDIALPLSHSA